MKLLASDVAGPFTLSSADGAWLSSCIRIWHSATMHLYPYHIPDAMRSQNAGGRGV